MNAAAAPALRALDDLPHPAGLPLVGNALGIEVPRMHLQLEAWDRDHGPVFTYRLGRRPTLCISDPALIDAVYRRRPKTFRRLHTVADVVEELSIHGVFTAEGSAWVPQRKLAMRALHAKHLDSFFPMLRDKTAALVARWRRTEGSPTDLLHDFRCFTIDVTTQLAFAHPTRTLAGEQSALLDAIDPIFPALSRRIVAVLPTWRWFKRPGDRVLEASVARVRAFLDEVIAQARAEVRPDTEATNFLEAMLASDAGGGPDEAGGLGDEALFGNAMTMLLAGEDTTAGSLAWAAHLLMDHPEVVERLRAETAGALDADGIAPDRDATRVPYVDQVIHEVMRLRSVGPMLFFEAVEDTTLGDIALPAGTPITLLTRRTGMDPDLFPEPERFDPDRWADPKRVAQLQKSGVFTPFGSGPRICPGRELALLEMRLVLPTLVHGFDMERVGTAADVEEVNGFTMSPSAVPAGLRPRDRGAR